MVVLVLGTFVDLAQGDSLLCCWLGTYRHFESMHASGTSLGILAELVSVNPPPDMRLGCPQVVEDKADG